MKPRHVVDEVMRRSDDQGGLLRFYWVDVRGNRGEFECELRELGGNLPFCPIIVRWGGFVDPHAVAGDLLRVIEEARTQLLQRDLTERIRAANRLDLVLIARRELELDSSSSPLVLPSWFPVSPGTVVTATIMDLTWSTYVSLRAEEVRVGEIGRLLFELDRELVSHLRASYEQDHRLVNSLHDVLRTKDDASISFPDLLSSAEASLDRVTNPRFYRPRTSRNPTLVGRLWRLANTTHADGLRREAKRTVGALRLAPPTPPPDINESLMAVLSRPSSPIKDPFDRWGFNLIVTIRAACQLITAEAHADEYEAYPLPLVRSVSQDIRTSLDEAIRTLERHRPSPT